ncbi:SDR family NAD(P)-dependent oxidoreductase [Actinacidiphila epipremni]|uniref:SDR family NAD(P)-dependent oxidoreductase n=1 Tax=Actinacidiphila epipremni TaxID=2053013 RepID=A0ABX0ZVW8_9ACTN|nr:SDR family NAD(P)-dependent oxidoreductase [Actinacidiphila epipremni]NJP45751.1 SDR family NAD(P)-dependent oxidoreductase [Actinacidiphila epipremni]
MATIADRAVLVTGANRGIGRALVQEALDRGAARVYAAARQPVPPADERVVPLTLDVTSPEQIRQAAAAVPALDVLVNNAGRYGEDVLGDPAVLEAILAVNLHGTLGVTRAFTPHLVAAAGTVVNNLSLQALAPLPLTASYSLSKAAAFSMTQSLRTLLGDRGVRVHAVLTGPVDTDMTRGLDIPKVAPASVAAAIFDGVEKDEEDIFPDPLSRGMAESWHTGAVKAFERELAAMARAAAGPAA